MGERRRVVVAFPSSEISEIDSFLQEKGQNRSEFVREAVRYYLKRRAKSGIRSELKEGYIRMAEMNLQLAQEAEAQDELTLQGYESALAEREAFGD